jgi:hypothetical protein
MKLLISIFTMFALTFGMSASAGGGGAQGQKFVKVFYVAFGGAAANAGTSYDAAKPFTDGSLWSIPVGTVIEKVYAIIDVAVTGTTDVDIGDDDTSNGYLDGSVSLTLGTTGMYGWDAKNAGSYLRIQTAGATDAGDIYVVPSAKYYKVSGKSLKLDGTGAATAGKMRIVVEGYYAGVKP